MRTKQAMKNMIASLMLQAVLALSGIIVPKFFTALYGSAVNGLVSSISQFISYMSLVEAGIGAAGTVALYGPIARNETDEINSIVSAAKKFYYRSGFIFLGLVIALVIFYPFAVDNEIQNVSFIRMMIIILSFNGIVDYFFLGKYRVLLLADQRGYVISIVQLIGTVVMIVISLILIDAEVSALWVKGTTAIIYLVRSLFIAFYAKHHYRYLCLKAPPKMEAFSQRWSALVHEIAGMIVNNTDIILLTLLLASNALEEVSVYSIYNLVAYSLWLLMNSIATGIRSSFGQIISNNEKDVLNKNFSVYELFVFMLIFIAYSCMAVLMYPFISLYCMNFNDGVIYPRWELVMLFTAIGVVQSVRLPGSTITVAAGHFKQTENRAIIEASINLIASLILIKPLGIIGVLIGTLLSYLYRSTDVIFYNNKYFLPNTIKRTFLRLIRNLILMLFLVLGGLHFIPQTMNGWINWFVYAIIFGIISVSVVSFVNFCIEPKIFKSTIKKFFKIIKKS